MQVCSYAERGLVAAETKKDKQQMNEVIERKQGEQHAESFLFLFIAVYGLEAIVAHHQQGDENNGC